MNEFLFIKESTCTQVNHTLGFGEAMFFMFVIFFAALTFHELGHYIVAKAKGYDPVIKFKNFKVYTELKSQPSVEDNKSIAIAGIFLGSVVVFIAGNIHLFYGLLFAPYLLGCMSDFKEMFSK